MQALDPGARVTDFIDATTPAALGHVAAHRHYGHRPAVPGPPPAGRPTSPGQRRQASIAWQTSPPSQRRGQQANITARQAAANIAASPATSPSKHRQAAASIANGARPTPPPGKHRQANVARPITSRGQPPRQAHVARPTPPGQPQQQHRRRGGKHRRQQANINVARQRRQANIAVVGPALATSPGQYRQANVASGRPATAPGPLLAVRGQANPIAIPASSDESSAAGITADSSADPARHHSAGLTREPAGSGLVSLQVVRPASMPGTLKHRCRPAAGTSLIRIRTLILHARSTASSRGQQNEECLEMTGPRPGTLVTRLSHLFHAHGTYNAPIEKGPPI